MGLFGKAEKKIEGLVSGIFARAFKGDVQPVEIAARIQRELDSKAELLNRDEKLVPNNFIVRLSRYDYDRLLPYSATLNKEIASQLHEYARSQSYIFNGAISLQYLCDESLPTGRFTINSEAVAAVDQKVVSTSDFRRSQLVLEVNGVRHPLVAPGLLIGRGSETDLRINDPGISRKHAQILVSGSPLAPNVTIQDLGSTNGIKVNGTRTTSATLVEGTEVLIGSTILKVLSASEAE